MDITSLAGITASVLVIIAFFPQVIKSIISKDVEDISLTMYLLAISGTILWTLYGYFTKRMPVFITNAMIFFPQLIILSLKIKSEFHKWKNMKS